MDFFFNYHCQNHSVDAKSLWPITTFYLSSYLHNFARIFIIQASYHTVPNLHFLSKHSTSRIHSNSNFSAKISLRWNEKFCQNVFFWRKLDFWSSVYHSSKSKPIISHHFSIIDKVLQWWFFSPAFVASSVQSSSAWMKQSVWKVYQKHVWTDTCKPSYRLHFQSGDSKGSQLMWNEQMQLLNLERK